MVGKSAVFNHFEKNDEDENVYTCKVKKEDGVICNFKLGSKTSNLKRHLQRHHINIFGIVTKNDKLQKTLVIDKSNSSTSGHTSILQYFSCEKVTISMNKEKLKRGIIQMVVNNGVALKLFSSPAFIGLNGELANKLGVSLERHDIRDMVVEEAKKEKIVLKKMLRDKFCFLKMDACTRQRINYFAINVQFVDDNNTLTIRTLAVRDTKS